MDGDPSDKLQSESVFSPISLDDQILNPPPPNPDPISPITQPDPTRKLSVFSPNQASSPLNSPRTPNPRSQPSMPSTPPFLTDLINSTLTGDSTSLENLKNVASTDNSRSVVDAFLAIMGGIDGFDDACSQEFAPTVMINPHASVIVAKLINALPYESLSDNLESSRDRMVRGLFRILSACSRNRALCSACGLLSALLDSVESVCESEWDGVELCKCVEVLAGFSLSVKDLKHLLELTNKCLGNEWGMRLVLVLENSMKTEEVRGPKITFEFDGESSGLLGPGESRWPFYNGYAFATWIYIESFADTLNTATTAATIAAAAAASVGKSSAMSAAAAATALAGEGMTHMPRLFSFISSDNHGIEAYFHGQFLVVETGSGGGKGKKQSLHFTYNFKPQCWYFIGLEHFCKSGMMGKVESELRLYVDGKLYESRPFEFPRVTRSLAFCCVGTNPPPTMAGLQTRRRQCPLFAEMGPVYIFKESIGMERMRRLAYRGGDYLPSFGSGAGSPWIGNSEEVKGMYMEYTKLDAEIGESLHLLYHPCLLNGRFCPDASPSGAAGILRRPAEVLGQVHIACRLRPSDSLWAFSYGGPMVLLPLLVSNAQIDTLEPIPDDSTSAFDTASLSAPIFRIISMAIQHHGNNEELIRSRAPEILSRTLQYLLQNIYGFGSKKHDGLNDEDLVTSVISLCQSQKNHAFKVQLFTTLLLDLKIWNYCNYGLQKKLLSSLADMVFSESLAMRDANALHLLLDGCRRCYWIIREENSIDRYPFIEASRRVGELNDLVDELMVVIELLIGASSPSKANEDVKSLIGFMVDCPQPNQIARVLHLLYRLMVQPNTSKSQTFAQSFVSSRGIEALLFLLQQEAKIGDHSVIENTRSNSAESTIKDSGLVNTFKDSESTNENCEKFDDHVRQSNSEEPIYNVEEPKQNSFVLDSETSSGFQPEIAGVEAEEIEVELKSPRTGVLRIVKRDDEGAEVELKSPESETSANLDDSMNNPSSVNIERLPSTCPSQLLKTIGDISFSINAESGRSNMYNIDNGDGIVVGVIKVLGALITSGHLTFCSNSASSVFPNKTAPSGFSEHDNPIHGDKISLLLLGLQKAFEAAPNRLMTSNVYMALLGATINFSSTDDKLSLYDSVHRFEHGQLLLVLLRSLPYASRTFQLRALQDLLFLACSHPENRNTLTLMEEWPEWILDVLISNYETESNKISCDVSIAEIDDLIHNFLIIMLEHSMRQKDGWKDVESTIHCAEWLSVIGGSSTGEQRSRREESLPLFKRRLLGGLLDFASRELQVQTQVIAAAAAGVAAEGLSPREAKAEAENAAQLSVALAENAIVILMLVEDHLRSRGQLFFSSRSMEANNMIPASASSANSHLDSLGNTLDLTRFRRTSTSNDAGGLPLDVLASMADANGKISAAVMERLTAAAAAEPYESVRSAFISYGSYISDLSEGWTLRSRMWYGVGLQSKTAPFIGGGSGFDVWNLNLEKDVNGKWIELPLMKKSIAMLQALLLDECGLGSGVGISGGPVSGMSGMTSLYQLLDSDQPFLCMLRMTLASMREDDNGEDNVLMRNISIKDGISDGLSLESWKIMPSDNNSLLTRKPHRGLLWSVLAPILNMPISESKRQRVLVASCILYAEVWHSIGKDRNPIRKQYLEAILPPFIAILRRWRPLLAGIHDLTSADGLNPLIVDDRALAADSLPIEAALSMISPGWAAAFASPPAAMALAMMAAGAGGETTISSKNTPLKRDSSNFERMTTRSNTFTNFSRPPDIHTKSSSVPKDKAAAKAIAMATARDLERNAKIGSGRGLSAVAMATSAQRRTSRDTERANRWNISEALGTAWKECLHPVDSKSNSSLQTNNKFVGLLVTSFSLARELQRDEIKRRSNQYALDRYYQAVGIRFWRKFIHRLIETAGLFGPLAEQLYDSQHVFWKLDFAESSSRMRRFFIRNFKGTNHFGAAADYEDHPVPNNSDRLETNLPSNTSIIISDAVSIEDGNDNDEQMETDNSENIIENEQASLSWSSVSDQPKRATAIDSSISQSMPFPSPDHVPCETDEEVILELSSLMIRPLKIVTGTFQVTTKRINFIAKEKTDGENVEKEKDRSWTMSSLHQIYSRRYLLRRSALELFMVDRSNFFFDFGSIELQKKAYRAVVQARPPHLNNVYLATQRPDQLFKRTQLMERWARWELSNFEYLMELNTMAGRSYNDITQYPVFPWILADYSSKALDLNDPSSYRDLSKPVGALNPDRLKKFQERYSSFDDPMIPKFHYGSHYSSAGTVSIKFSKL